MQIIYLTCPKCENEFYITDEFVGQGRDWFCPRCNHVFKEEESLSAPGKARGARTTAGM